jgi:hypothetical protein
MTSLPCINTLLIRNYFAEQDRQSELMEIAHEERKDALYDDMANDPKVLADTVTGDQLTLEFEHEFCALLSACLPTPGSDEKQLERFQIINQKADKLLKLMAEYIAERE